MAPKQDLRGGKASADSFAMSRSVIVASTSLNLFAEQSRKLVKAKYNGLDCVHEPCAASAPETSRGRLLCEADMVWSMWDAETRVVVVRKVQAVYHEASSPRPRRLHVTVGKRLHSHATPGSACPAESTMSNLRGAGHCTRDVPRTLNIKRA